MTSSRRSWLLAASVAVFPAGGAAAQVPAARSAFSGFETTFLPNGLKVWYRRLPGDPTVSVSVSVRAGFDQDPPGQDDLSHFTEHMLFSDHRGRTEEEIKREIEDRGGVRNGFTTFDHTFYFARVGARHGLVAIDWLSRILSPHAMDSAIVERQRAPVAVERGAKRRQLFDWIYAWYLNPPALRPSGFWEREFGIATGWTRDVDRWRSLYRIGPADLRGFYERYYAPSRMTLMVVGDLDRDSVLAAIRSTFGNLEPRGAAPDTVTLHDPGRARRVFTWTFDASAQIDLRYRLYNLDAADDIRLVFLSRWLAHRLNARLRYGVRKAVYGIGVFPSRRGRAAYLGLFTSVRPAELAFARDVIADEIGALRSGSRSDSAFGASRDAIAHQLRTQDASAKELETWLAGSFFDERVHRDFPDLVAAFDSMPKREIESFVRRQMPPEREVLRLAYRAPVSQGAVAMLVLGLAWLALRLVRRALLRPLDMTRVRYVARFRLPIAYRVVAIPLFIAAVAIGLRLLVYAFTVIADRLLLRVDSIWVQWPAFALMFVALVAVLVASLALLPRKLLVFEDGVAIKYLAYRSEWIPAAELSEVSLRRFREVWLSRDLPRCRPLALGLWRPGIYLRRRDGRAWFFKVRDIEECLGAIRSRASSR